VSIEHINKAIRDSSHVLSAAQVAVADKDLPRINELLSSMRQNLGRLDSFSKMLPANDGEAFVRAFNAVADSVHSTTVAKGFWPEDKSTRNKGEAIMLMVTELAEGVEALRHGNPPDDKVPQFSGEAAELADCIIRIMDYAQGFGVPVAEALVAKAKMNTGRGHKHGKTF
jgi:NTP pyrophosphatase (non-canonical NTP hydrolase)